MKYSIVNIIMNLYYNVLYIFFRLCIKIGIFTFEKKESFLDLDEKYIFPIKTRFLKNMDNPNQNQEINFNENIEETFYDKKAFSICVSESDNILESTWRTRIMFETTSRGNVIMFYDAYKMGFSYYSDQNTMSYDILNAVAMKYVSIYRCRDFFMDETIIPTGYPSPFIELYLKDDTKSTIKTSDKSAFVKLQNYSKSTKIQSLLKDVTKDSMFSKTLSKKGGETTDEPEKIKNKFMYLGKICNFKILQKYPKKNKFLGNFSSPLLDNIKLESNVQRERLSYVDFKKSICKT